MIAMKPIQACIPPAWTVDAECLNTDTDVFYVERGGSHRIAKAMCARCPVAHECLEWALERNEPWGIFGGLSARQRRPLIAARRRAAA